ncbi:hypothetical protein QFZ34_001031 [Phyllobacterium ifriqiyense]|uniref:Polysaccharide pyruvyl transferase domain-containing protein n=1 Tax=Phyllobacterium ifriqiyense TaxID=314238 RepID=A0ABU0S517_9HYPH|nr:hypothetical protein [Phyllobacterium ifriqiyense]
MARVLVMSPSGEVYDHDNVRWYQHSDIQKYIDHYHNIGDAFVFDSSLKLMNFEKLRELPLGEPNFDQIDRLKEEYDYVILRGSNYIHQHMGWPHAIAVLKRLGLPVIAWGIGAQAPVEGQIQLPEDLKTLLKIMADSTASIGVRGAYSAQVLKDIGIDNVRIVGCPTAFRRNDPTLKVTLPLLEDVRHVGLTVRREVSPAYARNIERYLTFHRDLIKDTASKFDVTLMAQGEIEEKKLVFGTDEQKEDAIAALKANRWASDWYLDDTIEKLYRERLFYSDVVADYEKIGADKRSRIGLPAARQSYGFGQWGAINLFYL